MLKVKVLIKEIEIILEHFFLVQPSFASLNSLFFIHNATETGWCSIKKKKQSEGAEPQTMISFISPSQQNKWITNPRRFTPPLSRAVKAQGNGKHI